MADIAVSKIDSPDPVVSGHDITYTLTLSNLGGIIADNVRLTDTVPANTTFVSFTQTSGPTFTLTSPPVGGTGAATATIATLGAGQSATFSLVVRTSAGLVNKTLISNTVTATTDTIESSPANNTATATTRIGPVQFVAAGAAKGTRPRVDVYNRTGAIVASFLAYPANFRGGVRVAVGDVNGDGTADIITAPGPGAPRNVQVIDGTKLNQIPVGGRVPPTVLLANIVGFPKVGIFVAAGDVNADGRDDVILGAGGGTPRLRVYDGASGGLVASFLAYPKNFTGGVTVAAGDVNGDGRADVLTGPASGARPVQVIDGTKLGLVIAGGRISPAALVGIYFPFAPRFSGGVNVAAGDINGDGRADIIVAPAAHSAPLVKVLDASGALLANQLVFAQSFRGGVQVGAMELDLDGLAEVLVGTGPNRRTILGLDMLQGRVEFALTIGFAGTSIAGV